MSMHLSHSHQIYCNDNTTFYSILEDAVHRTLYEASIKPFQLTRAGRSSYLALIAQHAGKYKWVVILRDVGSYVSERKCKGTTIHTLQIHVERCRAAYVKIETASQHVTEQIPNQLTHLQNFRGYVEVALTQSSVLVFPQCPTISMAWVLILNYRWRTFFQHAL